MNTQFQDSNFSQENLRLYLETPAEDLTKNVNPRAQRWVLFSKKNEYLKSLSPDQLQQKVKQNLSAYHQRLYPFNNQPSFQNLKISSKSLLPYLKTATHDQHQRLRSSDSEAQLKSPINQTVDEKNNNYKSYTKRLKESAIEGNMTPERNSRIGFIKQKYESSMKNTYCLRNKHPKNGSHSPDINEFQNSGLLKNSNSTQQMLGIFIVKSKENSSGGQYSGEQNLRRELGNSRNGSKSKYKKIFQMMQIDKNSTSCDGPSYFDANTNGSFTNFLIGNNQFSKSGKFSKQDIVFDPSKRPKTENQCSEPKKIKIMSKNLNQSKTQFSGTSYDQKSKWIQLNNQQQPSSPVQPWQQQLQNSFLQNGAIKQIFHSQQDPAPAEPFQEEIPIETKRQSFTIGMLHSNSNQIHKPLIQINQVKKESDHCYSNSKENIPTLMSIKSTGKATEVTSQEQRNELYESDEEEENGAVNPAIEIKNLINTLDQYGGENYETPISSMKDYEEDRNASKLLSRTSISMKIQDFVEEEESRNGGIKEEEEETNQEDEEHGFVIKKTIDFNQLKLLRNKTINRIMGGGTPQVRSQQKITIPEAGSQQKIQIPSKQNIQLAKGSQLDKSKDKNNSNSNDSLKQKDSQQQQPSTFKDANKNDKAKKLKKINSTIKQYLKSDVKKVKKKQKDEENKEEVQRQADKLIATKLQEVKDKMRVGVKNVLREQIQKRMVSNLSQSSKGNSTPQNASTPQKQKQNQGGANAGQSFFGFKASQVDSSQKNKNQTYDEQQKEVAEYSSAIMNFFDSCIDNLNEKEGQVNQTFHLRGLKNFNQQMSENLVKTFEAEMKKQNMSEESVERFKYIYEINTKMHLLYSGMVHTLGGIDKVKELIEQVVKKVSSHITMFPINHVYSFEVMHRRIIPGICALLCDDQRLFLSTLRFFLESNLADKVDFSFIDFYFIKKELFSLLNKKKTQEISPSLTLGIMQKIESVRRYIFPIHVLADNEVREDITNKLFDCHSFTQYFHPLLFKKENLRSLIDHLFDYFYLGSDDSAITDFNRFTMLLQPLINKKISRKIIDFIELFTQQALQEDRYTLSIVIRDLHYKFTKVRLRMGFKQGIFGIFKFEQNLELIEAIRIENDTSIIYNPSKFNPQEQEKLKDLTFLKHYMRFLISEFDIFSVYDFSVAMSYFGVTKKVFSFWMQSLRTVLLTKYSFMPFQADIFVNFAEACCQSV